MSATSGYSTQGGSRGQSIHDVTTEANNLNDRTLTPSRMSTHSDNNSATGAEEILNRSHDSYQSDIDASTEEQVRILTIPELGGKIGDIVNKEISLLKGKPGKNNATRIAQIVSAKISELFPLVRGESSELSQYLSNFDILSTTDFQRFLTKFNHTQSIVNSVCEKLQCTENLVIAGIDSLIESNNANNWHETLELQKEYFRGKLATLSSEVDQLRFEREEADAENILLREKIVKLECELKKNQGTATTMRFTNEQFQNTSTPLIHPRLPPQPVRNQGNVPLLSVVENSCGLSTENTQNVTNMQHRVNYNQPEYPQPSHSRDIPYESINNMGGPNFSDLLLQMSQALTAPAVKQFNREDKDYSYTEFIRNFKLRYDIPGSSNARKVELLRHHLCGHAASTFDAFNENIKSSLLNHVINSLRENLLENSTLTAQQACSELRRLRHLKDEPMVKLFSKIEQLTRKAMPTADNATRSILQADSLINALSYRTDAHLLIREQQDATPEQAYEKVRQLAVRLEATDKTLPFQKRALTQKTNNSHGHYHSNTNAGNFNNLQKGNNFERNRPTENNYRQGETNRQNQHSNTNQNRGNFHQGNNRPRVNALKKNKHLNRNNSRQTSVPDNEEDNQPAWLHSLTCSNVMVPDDIKPFVGESSVDVINLQGANIPVLLDSGSVVSVIPSNVVKRLCREKVVKLNQLTEGWPLPIFDASGNRMNIIGRAVVDMELRGIRNTVHMLIAKVDYDHVILGTNALPSLGVNTNFRLANEPPEPDKKAKVAKRTVIPPHSSAQLILYGAIPTNNIFFWASNDQLDSGYTEPDGSGLTSIEVRNTTDAGLMFCEDEIVGEWLAENDIQDIQSEIKPTLVAKLDLTPVSIPADRKNALMESLKLNGMPNSQQLEQVVWQFQDRFALSEEELTQTDTIQAIIDTGENEPIKLKQRPVPLPLRGQVEELLSRLLEQGVISPSNSPWASPIVLVKKKDNSIRLCVDYRKLNEVVRADAHPLPLINQVLSNMAGKRIFTSLDMLAGYWQVGFDNDSREKTAFSTMNRLFEFNVLPFGLHTSPAMFQRLVEKVFDGLIGKIVHVYLDDVLVASSSLEEHFEHLSIVFSRLREFNLKLKASKCFIAQSEVIFLGHKLTDKGLAVDDEKVEKILKFPTPRSVPELRSFLGMLNYYRRFISKFSVIAAPLYELTSTKQTWVWSEKRETAFKTLCKLISAAPILGQPDVEAARNGERPFLIFSDASKIGYGGVLCQANKDGIIHPLYFASKSCSKAETNYHVTDAEALAVVFCIRQFKMFIYGTPVTIYTDHQPLTALFSRTNVAPRIFRWSLEMQDYKLKVLYIQGRANVVADALSRGPIESTIISDTPISIESVISKLETSDHPWKLALASDLVLHRFIANLETGELSDQISLPESPDIYHKADFVVKEGLLYLIMPKHGLRMFVPKQFRVKLIEEAHSGTFAGHFSAKKISKQLENEYFWPNMNQEIRQVIAKCLDCALHNPTKILNPPLHPITSQKPFEIVGVDLIDMGTSRRGNRYLLTIIDHFSKWGNAYPIPKKDAETVSRTFIQQYVCQTAKVPKQLLSDRGNEFLNATLSSALETLGCQHILTKGYDSRANGLTERFNRTLEQMMRKVVEIPLDWDDQVHFCLFAYNTTFHATTGESPYFLLYGYDPHIPLKESPRHKISINHLDSDEYKVELLAGLKITHETVRERIHTEAAKMKERFDQNAVNEKCLPKIGERVFAKMPTEKNKAQFPKLTCDWQGPYRVIESSITSALLEPLFPNGHKIRVQHDMLRKARPELPDTPVVTKSSRAKPRKTNSETKQVKHSYGTRKNGIQISSNSITVYHSRDLFTEGCTHTHDLSVLPDNLKPYASMFHHQFNIKSVFLSTIAAHDPTGAWTPARLAIAATKSFCPELKDDVAKEAVNVLLTVCPTKAYHLIPSRPWCPATHNQWFNAITTALQNCETAVVSTPLPISSSDKHNASAMMNAVIAPAQYFEGTSIRTSDIRRVSSTTECTEQLKIREQHRRFALNTFVCIPFNDEPNIEEFEELLNQLTRIRLVVKDSTTWITVVPTEQFTPNTKSMDKMKFWEVKMAKAVEEGCKTVSPSAGDDQYHVCLPTFTENKITIDSIVRWFSTVFPELQVSESLKRSYNSTSRGGPPFKRGTGRGTFPRGRGGM